MNIYSCCLGSIILGQDIDNRLQKKIRMEITVFTPMYTNCDLQCVYKIFSLTLLRAKENDIGPAIRKETEKGILNL